VIGRSFTRKNIARGKIMDLFHNAISTISLMIFMVLTVFYMRHRQLLHPRDAPAVSRVITEIVLPLYLFRQLSHSNLSLSSLNAVFALILVELAIAGMAYSASRWFLRLSDEMLAIFVLCSTFSSTGLLGNSFLKILYNDNVSAVTEGILVGQLAITTPNYLLTPAILSRYSVRVSASTIFGSLMNSFMNPPNLAILSGILWALASLPKSGFILDPAFGAMKLIGDTIPFLVAITIGLSLNEFPSKRFYNIIFVCALFDLLSKPILTFLFDIRFHEASIDRQVSFLLASMPAAPFIAVYAVRYNTVPKFAATLVTSTLILSAVTIPALLLLFKSVGQ